MNGDSATIEPLKTEQRWREGAKDGHRRVVGLYIKRGFPIWVEPVLEELQMTEKKLGTRDDLAEKKAHEQLKRLSTMLQAEIKIQKKKRA